MRVFILFIFLGLSKELSARDIFASAQILKARIDTIDLYLSQLAGEKNFSGGMMIMKGNELLLCNGYGYADRERKFPFTAGTLASMGSITKAFTASAIMKLVEEQNLELNDRLAKFFPDIPSDKQDITIHQLLTHSSGFQEFVQGDGGDYEGIKSGAYLQRAFKEPLAFKPGEKAVYTNVGMSILGIIVEKISGMDYEKFLLERLLKPAGIAKIGYHHPPANDDTIAIGYQDGKIWGTHQQKFAIAGGGPYWNLKANGGLEASLYDMHLWVKGLNNATMLRKESIAKMFTAHRVEDGTEGRFSFGYGCNIYQSKRNTKVIENGGSNGIFFARLIRLPEEDLVFYMVTNESSMNANMVLPNIMQLFFDGKIVQDAVILNRQADNEQANKIYDLVQITDGSNFEKEIQSKGLVPEDDMVLYHAGQRLIQEKKLRQAVTLYKYYTKIFPNIVVAWNDLGECYMELQSNAEAVKCFLKALELRPGNERATENLKRLK